MKTPMQCLKSLALILVLSCFGWAQGDTAAMKVSLCDLYMNAQQYVGKMVEVRATIVGYRDPTVEMPSFSRQEPCSAYLNIALELPQNVSPRPPFDLERDASFRKYEGALQKPMRIEATLEGRFDAVFVWKDRKRVRIAEGQGFGKKHAADARLVLHRMSDVLTRNIPRR